MKLGGTPSGSTATIKLTPSGNSAAPAGTGTGSGTTATIKLTPGGSGTLPPAGTASKSPTIKLTPAGSAAAPAEAPAENTAAGAAPVKMKPAGGKTMKLRKGPSSGTPGFTDIGISPDAAAEVAKKTSAAKQTEAGPVFLILSIVAFLVISFTVFVMSAQFANMYHGKDIKVPGLQQSGK